MSCLSLSCQLSPAAFGTRFSLFGLLLNRLKANRELINFAQQFAAQLFFAGLAAGHYALGCGEDIDPQSAQHARNGAVADVDAAAGARNALELRDGRRVVGPILEV